jgi:hypothetical protein
VRLLEPGTSMTASTVARGSISFMIFLNASQLREQFVLRFQVVGFQKAFAFAFLAPPPGYPCTLTFIYG